MEWPPKHRWEYTCTPELTLPQKAADLVLHYPWMKTFIMGELSHAWHYRRWNPTQDPREGKFDSRHFVYVEGDPLATPAEMPFGVAIGHLGGWKQGRILQPDTRRISSARMPEKWHYGFYAGGAYQECILDLYGPAMIKVGRNSFYATLLDERGNTLPTRISPPVRIADPSIPWPRI